MGATAIITISMSLASLSSPAALWTMAHQMQLLLLLILTKKYFPDDVKAVLLSNDFMLFDWSFIPCAKIPLVNLAMDAIDSEQENVYLETIGLESRSGLVNFISVITVILFLVALHVCILFIPKLKVAFENQKCRIRINKLKIHLCELFKFTVYVRVVFEAFQHLLLCTFSEVKIADFSKVSTTVSFSISC
jgi:hypothetical protein